MKTPSLKTYLFLDNDIYSPETQTGVFGKEVEITEKKGDEIWFTFKESGKKGYVVYPQLFAENTNQNQERIKSYMKLLNDSEELKKGAFSVLEKVDRAIL